ncbi:MAG: DUF4118 domain-containing protein, partial [Proteobacteria bacterium]
TGLLKRLREGKVYLEDKAERAAQNFFKEAPLSALREIALRLTAEKVDFDLKDYTKLNSNEGPWNTNDRLMVAVSHSPYSERLIRATRKYAFNLEAPWIAVNIDMGIELSLKDQNQLSKNLSLARLLGAEVVTISDVDVTSALQTIAKQRNVSQLVMGRPTPRFFRDHFFGGTSLDKLVRQSGDFDVHVIRQETSAKAAKTLLSHMSSVSGLIQYWYVLWIIILVTVFTSGFGELVGFRSIGFIYLIAILFLSLVFSLGPLFFAAGLSALMWNFFFIPPKYTFAISSSEDILLCLSYFFVSITTGYLTHRIRKHEKIFQQREERTQVLYQITKDIVSGVKKEIYLPSIAEQLSRILQADCGFILLNQESKLNFDTIFSAELWSLSEKEQAVAVWAFENGKPAGWGTDNLPSSRYYYHPLRATEEFVAMLVLKPRKIRRLSIDQENLIFTVGNQVALSLERDILEIKSKSADQLKE